MKLMLEINTCLYLTTPTGEQVGFTFAPIDHQVVSPNTGSQWQKQVADITTKSGVIGVAVAPVV
jgi:hypothetical protein